MPRLLATLLVAAALVAGCGSGSSQPDEGTASQEVSSLSNVLELRAAFNEDRGTPRLLLLLSPT